MLGLSEAHLLRLFHREVGKTFRRHLRDARMIGAAELMKQTARSIKQIALDCGYSDISNFYRDFKSVHGTTPRDVRLRELAVSLKPMGDRRAGKSNLLHTRAD
jgi:AraC-like DNA-binding protein